MSDMKISEVRIKWNEFKQTYDGLLELSDGLVDGNRCMVQLTHNNCIRLIKSVVYDISEISRNGSRLDYTNPHLPIDSPVPEITSDPIPTTDNEAPNVQKADDDLPF